MRTPPRIGVDTCWHALAIRPFVRLVCMLQCLRAFFPRRASAGVVRVEGSRGGGAPQPRGGQPLGSRHARTPAQAAERIRAAGAARPGPAASSRWGLGARALQHARISRKLQQGIGPAVGIVLKPAFGQLELEPTCDGPFGLRRVGPAVCSSLPKLFSLPKLCFTI